MSDSERTIPATPQRIREARERGEVARSRELTSVVTLLALLGGVGFSIPRLVEGISDLARECWGETMIHSGGEMIPAMTASVGILAGLVGRMLLIVGTVPFLVMLVQRGWLFLPGDLVPDFSRLDPRRGWRRIVSVGGVTRLLLGLTQTLLIATVVYYFLFRNPEKLLTWASLSTSAIAMRWGNDLLLFGGVGCGVLLLPGLADFLYQRWKLSRDLRMTPEEFRRQQREMLGDDRMTAKRVELQREMRSRFGRSGR